MAERRPTESSFLKIKNVWKTTGEVSGAWKG
jgi:hypothetical protein